MSTTHRVMSAQQARENDLIVVSCACFLFPGVGLFPSHPLLGNRILKGEIRFMKGNNKNEFNVYIQEPDSKAMTLLTDYTMIAYRILMQPFAYLLPLAYL